MQGDAGIVSSQALTTINTIIGYQLLESLSRFRGNDV